MLETEFKSSSMMVKIEGKEFRMHNCGSQATVAGLKHTNLCFYLSATADVRYDIHSWYVRYICGSSCGVVSFMSFVLWK